MSLSSCQHRLFWLAFIAAGMAGCAANPNATNATGASGSAIESVARQATNLIGGPLIPNTNVHLSPTVIYPLEKIVYWGVWAGAAWLILDPLAPNWEIEEARFPEDHVHLQLAMRRYYAGGAGEARVVFHRRARELMRAGSFTGYEVLEYAEGMESSVLGAKRTATGVVRFSGKAAG